jgi:tyrosyl-tRNA synthetase
VVERPDEYGGDLEYEAYETVEADVESGELHPADAKSALASALDRLIAPGREQLQDRQDQ